MVESQTSEFASYCSFCISGAAVITMLQCVGSVALSAVCMYEEIPVRRQSVSSMLYLSIALSAVHLHTFCLEASVDMCNCKCNGSKSDK